MYLETNRLRREQVNKTKLKEILRAAEKKFNIPECAKVSLNFVSEKEIKRLNKLCRGINKATDVLSFSYREVDMKEKEGGVEMGDIVICSNIAKKQARKKQHSFLEEVEFLFTHGFLHILGLTDESEKEASRMNRATRRILAEAKERDKE